MRPGSFFSETIGLRRAAAIIFTLAALLPLLALLPVLRTSGALWTLETQISLLLSLVLAGLGFVVLRGMVGQITRRAAAVPAPDAGAAPAHGIVSAARAGAVGQRGGRGLAGDAVCRPIRVEDPIIGVVPLATGDPARSFGPTDLQFLNTLLAQVAYALENARLLEEAQRSAARLQQAFEDLKAAQARIVEGETLRAMGQMASGMAHHLNNLLSVVAGRNQLLLLKVQDPGIRGPLEVLQRATLDAAQVVRRLLGFTGVRPVEPVARVDLSNLVREVVELTRPRWQDQAHVRGATIEVVPRLAPVLPVLGEAPPLREVIMNLLLHSVDALPEGGTITITTGPADGHPPCTLAH